MKSYAVLLFNKLDAASLQAQFDISYPEMKEIRRVYAALGSYLQLAVGGGLGQSFDFDMADFCQRFTFEALKTYACFRILEQDGWLTMTDGFYQPSAVKIIVNREILYDYELRTPELGRVLKGILRGLGGVMQDFVSFNEQQIAHFLKMSVSDLVAALHRLTADSIVDFRPQKSKPQLTFLRERIDYQYLAIDMTLFMFRKKRAEFRLKKAIEYAELEVCRSQQLLQYFGQLDAPTCGVCDVCLESGKRQLDTDDFETFKVKLQQLLKREPLSLKEIVDSFAEKHRTKVIQTIGFLLDEGILTKENDQFKF